MICQHCEHRFRPVVFEGEYDAFCPKCDRKVVSVFQLEAGKGWEKLAKRMKLAKQIQKERPELSLATILCASQAPTNCDGNWPELYKRDSTVSYFADYSVRFGDVITVFDRYCRASFFHHTHFGYNQLDLLNLHLNRLEKPL